MDFTIQVAEPAHVCYAEEVCRLIEEAAKARGTGIAKREPEYIRTKIEEGKAIIALHGDELAGFCYVETWGHGRYAANSGLIVAPHFRQAGLAKRIKRRAFELSRQKYPEAKLFGITTSLAVMKINSELGYKPVTFSELTTDEVFWQGCQSCPNYDVLTRMQRKMCLCTGMLYDPVREQEEQEKKKAREEAEKAAQKARKQEEKEQKKARENTSEQPGQTDKKRAKKEEKEKKRAERKARKEARKAARKARQDDDTPGTAAGEPP